MSLRSILGGSSRIRKASKASSTGSANRASPSKSKASQASPQSRRKASSGASSSNRRGARPPADEEDDDDLFQDKLDDVGLVRTLATDPNLRDTAQAIRHIRAHMFSPMPQEAAGMGSARVAEVLNYRRRLPPLVSVSHIQTLLASPSAVEREVADLVRAGFIRRVVVPGRGDVGDTLILAADFEQMVKEPPDLDAGARDALLAFLKENPGMQAVPQDSLSAAQITTLVQAGFLTAHHTGVRGYGALSGTMRLYSRPEDKGTLTSLETVSRQPAGSLGATGGEGAVHNAGGSGGGGASASSASATELKLAVPGNGSFLKLASSALDHLVALLGRSRFREAPESVLRERWDGGAEGSSTASAAARAKRARGEFAGILPGQTLKWRRFYGLSFDWILREAVGSGLVEVFDTGSVGRGVRAC